LATFPGWVAGGKTAVVEVERRRRHNLRTTHNNRSPPPFLAGNIPEAIPVEKTCPGGSVLCCCWMDGGKRMKLAWRAFLIFYVPAQLPPFKPPPVMDAWGEGSRGFAGPGASKRVKIGGDGGDAKPFLRAISQQGSGRCC
jgi:hypothetical protein